MPASSVACVGYCSLSCTKLVSGLVSLLIISLASSEAVLSVNLAWDANSEPNIAGYVLHYGKTQGQPTQSLEVGNATTATVSNLADGTTYFFTVTARNTAGLESAPSNEVSYTTPEMGEHKLTVINGTGSGSYTEGTQIQVNADPPPAGQQFDRWMGDYQIIDNPSESTAKVLMLFRDLTIEATYRPANQVTALSFNEGSGTAAADSSGSGHNGTLVNGPTWTAGKFGNGISLDGTDDYVSVANPSTLNFGTSNFTIALWIKRQATGAEHTIFSKAANTSWTTAGKQLFINPSNNRLTFECFGVGGVSSTGTITNDGLWHHVAVTFVDSSNTVSFYIDGVASGGGTLNLPADVSTHVVKIGGHPHPHPFRGQIDEFRIFSRALSASEVQNMMNNPIPPAQL